MVPVRSVVYSPFSRVSLSTFLFFLFLFRCFLLDGKEFSQWSALKSFFCACDTSPVNRRRFRHHPKEKKWVKTSEGKDIFIISIPCVRVGEEGGRGFAAIHSSRTARLVYYQSGNLRNAVLETAASSSFIFLSTISHQSDRKNVI